MQYLSRFSDLLFAFQDQENIIVPVMFSWGEKWFCPYSYTQADIREFESNNSLECCHEVQIGKQNVRANKVYAGMERQKICPSSKSADSLVQVCNWFMTCLVHHWSHKYNVIEFFQNL